MANNTVPTKNTGDTLTAAEINDIASKANTKQEPLGFTPENAANKGIANGYASLGVDGKVPSGQLPSISGGNVPNGGATGQVLSKASNTDQDTTWTTPSGGGGTGDITPDTVKIGSPGGVIGGDIYFLGDSITYGNGASTAAKRFSTLVCSATGSTEHNFGVPFQHASQADLSNIPTKISTDKYLCIGYGTNEVINVPQTPSQYTTAMQAIIDDALAKSWPSSSIVILSGFYSASNPTNNADFLLMVAAAKALADTNNTLYVDCYNDLRDLTTINISADDIHPTDFGHYLTSKLVLSVLPTVFDVTTQKEVVNGTTELDSLIIRDLINKSGKTNHLFLLSIDDKGNVGMAASLKDDLELNRTILAGALKQKGANTPTGFDNINDILLNHGTKVYTGFTSPSIFTYTTVDDLANFIYSTNYSGGNYQFFVSGGVDGGHVLAFQIEANGDITPQKDLPVKKDQLIKTLFSGHTASVCVFTGAGATEYKNDYEQALYKWFVSGGTNGQNKIAMVLNQFGRLQLQYDNSTYTDIPSARLAINSTQEGFLAPRMTSTQRDAIESPAEGLEIWNLTTHKTNKFNGTEWREWADTTAS